MKMFLKYVLLFALFMALQIPLSMTESVINERTHYRDDAFDAVAQMQGGEQTLLSPVVVIPFQHHFWETKREADGETRRTRKTVHGQVSLTAASLNVEQQQQVEIREKGIYRVPIYSVDVKLSGTFNWPSVYRNTRTDDDEVIWGTPHVSLALAQQNSISALSELQWGSQHHAFLPGSELSVWQGRGVHANVAMPATTETIAFSLTLSVRGTRGLSFIPIAEKADIHLNSNWPHVRFSGSQLPDERELDEQRVRARWRTHALANNLPNQWQRCAQQNDCDAVLAGAIGAQLINPVDVYVNSERAVKYGVLFLVVTFAALVLYEALYQLKIHPVQYVFVGLSNSIFFLLLLSFAEQIGFLWAYTIAAIACLLVLTLYMQTALQSRARLTAFVAILALLYAALYFILQLEDFALLAGSVFLFILLAVAMLLTRHMDWYRLQNSLNAKKTVEEKDSLIGDIKL